MPTTTETNFDAFKTAYADAVIPNMTNGQWQVASGQRQLSWRGERMSLAEAAELYETICDGYNNFDPGMVTALAQMFEGSGIDATPARESSVCIYLHIPDNGELRQQVEDFIGKNWHADEVDYQEDGSLRIWWD